MLIRRRPEHPYTVSYLSKKLQTEPEMITAAAKLLRVSGYRISIIKKDKVAFKSAPDLLLAAEITNKLATKFIGQNVHAYKSVQSTNILAGQLADARAPEGTIIVSELQTKGRGRLGRNWFSAEEKGIYISIVVYPNIDPAHAPGLSLLTAVSLADTISTYDGLDVRLKWPNDCLINGRKTAGILIELSSELDHVHHAIIGVGININHQRRDFPGDIRKTATSIRAELKEKIHRVQLLQKFLKQFESDYLLFRKTGLKGLKKRIDKYSHLLGKKIKLNRKGSIYSGKAIDIDECGGLIVETKNGLKTFLAGEVTIVKK